ncbi:mitochondrial inner membrane protease atp23 [Bisporella sp. PMI_857]|nr:mitochondrial inner membrane protease atp23 [Bisporella sp. PMI_857]
MSASFPDNDPEKTGYDPSAPRWRNLLNIYSNKMSTRGLMAFREDAYIRNEERDIKRCEEWRDYCFSYSPMVIFMQKNIRALNGNLDASNVRCMRCPALRDEEGNIIGRKSGGFDPELGILICANEIRNRKHLEDTLSHEMVHAWDHLRWKVDYMDLRHAACLEIRASSLSGECRWAKEFFTRNQFNITQQHQNCVRKRAIQSVMHRPNCKDDVHATKVVNEVWDSCFSDTRPFDEIYR